MFFSKNAPTKDKAPLTNILFLQRIFPLPKKPPQQHRGCDLQQFLWDFAVAGALREPRLAGVDGSTSHADAGKQPLGRWLLFGFVCFFFGWFVFQDFFGDSFLGVWTVMIFCILCIVFFDLFYCCPYQDQERFFENIFFVDFWVILGLAKIFLLKKMETSFREKVLVFLGLRTTSEAKKSAWRRCCPPGRRCSSWPRRIRGRTPCRRPSKMIATGAGWMSLGGLRCVVLDSYLVAEFWKGWKT